MNGEYTHCVLHTQIAITLRLLTNVIDYLDNYQNIHLSI